MPFSIPALVFTPKATQLLKKIVISAHPVELVTFESQRITKSSVVHLNG
jgi:hypothetical protein